MVNNLKFRRQFLLSPQKCEDLKDWQLKPLGKYHLYVHPDCELTVLNSPSMHLALVGYIIDPADGNKLNQNILEDISQSNTLTGVCKKLYNYGGRFVLIIKQSEEYYIFHDACGLKSVFYTKYANEFYAASQPLLFKLFMPLDKGEKYHSYFNSAYVKSALEHWIPSGISLYDNVYQLVPNHYLQFSTCSQVRYWPDKERAEIPFDDGIKKASALLSKIMAAANQRYKLALALTGGLDSRCVLSACKPIAKDLFFYTLQYRDLTHSSNDIRIPHEILEKLGLNHNVIDCRKPLDPGFSEVYVNNTDIPHLYDWGLIAHGMMAEYPSEKIVVKGSCAEIGRCAFYKTGTHKEISSVEILLTTIANGMFSLNGWKEIPFIKKRVSEWLKEVRDDKSNMGHDVLDLFYWEQRMGSWQSQSQLEWDIVQEVFTPFSNRALLETMLSVNAKYRHKPKYQFFDALIRNLWQETLAVPFNPKSKARKMRILVNDVLKKLGIFLILKKLLKNPKKKIPVNPLESQVP